MSITNRLPLVAFLVALLTIAASPSAWAARNLWWDNFSSAAPSQTDCVKQAETIMTAEKAGQLASDADSVRAWSEQTIAVTECLKFGDQLIVMVLVNSDDAATGNQLFNALRAGMMKK